MKPLLKSGTIAALIIAVYAILLAVVAVRTPLRLDETLELAATTERHFPDLMHAVAVSPEAAPLEYVFQAAVAHRLGQARIDLRLLSLIWAVASMIAFWALCHVSRIRRPLLALVLFGLFPSHLMLAPVARPYEQALFFLVVSLLLFFSIRSRPTVLLTVLYAFAFALCIYTEPFAVLPVTGCLLFYLGAISRREERRAFWHLLPATAVAGLSYIPYAIWAIPQHSAVWLTVSPPPGSIYEQAFQSLTGTGILAWILSSILLATAVYGAWRSFRGSADVVPFCMFGAVLTTIAVVVPLDAVERSPVWPGHLVFLAPALVLLFCFATQASRSAILAVASGLVLAALFAAADADIVLHPPAFDPEAEAHAIPTFLKGDSCVVFVSEEQSRLVFLPFEPTLQNHECLNFFHQRIVLAVHAYVRADQLNNAETFFEGLNFRRSESERVGGGRIIVYTQPES